VFLRARREALKNLVCIAEHERDNVEDEVDDEETLCDWKPWDWLSGAGEHAGTVQVLVRLPPSSATPVAHILSDP
jgi:hypothetical protein